MAQSPIPRITPFFHAPSSSYSYVVNAPDDTACVVIDPVLDCETARARTNTTFADSLIAHIRDQKLELAWVLETHAHADRLSAGAYITEKLGGRIGIGAGIEQVQETWNTILDLSGPDRFIPDAFDGRFHDGDTIDVGALSIRVMHTPGHTPAAITYVVGDAAFIGDTLFMPDYGTARVDFPGGNGRELYRSIQRIFALGDGTRLCFCHDYLTETRKEHHSEITVAESRRDNIHIHDGISEADFVAMREARDKTLDFPKMLLLAVPFNLHGGRPPPPAPNGTSYIKVPFNRF